jgi:hypothetical protein
MKISEYILQMQSIMQEHGDLEVETIGAWFHRVSAEAPSVCYRKVLSGRESKPVFWDKYQKNADEVKGEKVCRV